MKVLHDLLLEYMGASAPDATEIERLLTLHSFEVEGVTTQDKYTVIDVDVLPNRSSDCLSHRGIAHEISALTGTKLAYDPLKETPACAPQIDILDFTPDAVACNRFSGALIRGVTVGPSPQWLRGRLIALGQRSINNVVDATNYVMLALGQPLHAYDTARITDASGVRMLGVRFAHDGEEVTTLTDEIYKLNSTVPVVVDGATDTVLGIAGIKGGKHAAVTEKTSDILLEAAHFDPAVVRRASQTLRLRTDASQRFENDVPIELPPYALHAVTTLITEIAGGEIIGYRDVYPKPALTHSVQVAHAQIEGLLGTLIPKDTVANIFDRLAFAHVLVDDRWEVTPPFERTDITIAEDVTEEVGRVYGYEHVQAVVPKPVPLTSVNARHYYSELIRTTLIDQGFSEIITSSFRKKDIIKLKNAFASDKGCLRSSLSKNVIEALEKNQPNRDLLGLFELRVFEIGTVFEKDPETQHVTEHLSLALGVRTKQHGYVPKDDIACMHIVAILETTLGVSVTTAPKQGCVELHLGDLFSKLPPPVAYDQLSVDTSTKTISYVPFSTYPYVLRDIALWVDAKTTSTMVETVLREAAGELCVRSTLFDVYEKDGRKSYAFRLVFQSPLRTLTDEEIIPIMQSLELAVREKGWEVR